MKSLKTIQTLSKIGKILSKIVSICCVVGVIGCAVGSVAMLIGLRVVKIGGRTLESILRTEAGVYTGTIWAAIAVGAILCIGEFFVAQMACRYFDHELQAGTPFTAGGAKELLHLGISCIWIPIVAIVLAQVAQEVIAHFMANTELLAIDGYQHVGLGVVFILIALFCQYGSELREAGDQTLS